MKCRLVPRRLVTVQVDALNAVEEVGVGTAGLGSEPCWVHGGGSHLEELVPERRVWRVGASPMF